jgi:predicted RNA-binding Zn-ribbon protein involved in translation (DUF1610 family)
MTQLSLFTVPVVDAAVSSPIRPRRQPARMHEADCPVCGAVFMSFVHGVRCDDCRKQARLTHRARPALTGRVSELGYVDVFPPGY